jgi:hypothetical protein
VKTWFDGFCKSCGAVVEEGGASELKDYMNRCTNKECEHHVWHHVYDDEFADYYHHKGRVVDGRVVDGRVVDEDWTPDK